jgi:hypothetical protein
MEDALLGVCCGLGTHLYGECERLEPCTESATL